MSVQVNVRVPLMGKETVLRVGQIIRDNPGAVEALEAFLDDFEDKVAAPTLLARVEALEARMTQLEGKA